MTFSTLGLLPELCSPLARFGYQEPTPIQTQAIPLVLTGTDLLARAQTGTGKTAAFGLPMIQRLFSGSRTTGRRRTPRGLVLVPTRELALQVHQSLTGFAAPVRLRTVAIFGGVGMGGQIQALRDGADIVVATPGRLLDHMQRRTIDLSGIEILTLDEGDRMLDMGFLPALRRVLAVLPRTRQTLLFSATISEDVVRLAGEFTTTPKRVDVSDKDVVAPTVTHHVHPVSTAAKRELLTHVLTQQRQDQALVFCKTKRGSDRIGEHLERAGIKAAVIHGNKSQGARTRALRDFTTGRVNVLVATDIAARGLDIARLPLVVNYDLPMVAEDYVHRVGRTGRAGLAGRAVSLVSPDDRHLLRDIQRLLPSPLEPVVVKGFETGATLNMTGDSPRSHRPAPGRGRRPSASPHARRQSTGRRYRSQSDRVVAAR